MGQKTFDVKRGGKTPRNGLRLLLRGRRNRP
jgi:hypothetical protein